MTKKLKYQAISHASQIKNICSQLEFNSGENIVNRKHLKSEFSELPVLFFNECFDKNRIKLLVSWSLKNCGRRLTIDLIENLKNLGFSYATQAGISLGVDDLKIPPTKNTLISSAEQNIKKTQINYKQEYLTGIEKFQHLIDTWHRTSEILKQDLISHFKFTDILNPVYMMAFSGARGNVSQVRQLAGMRGLMSDPQGQILDFPIKSNFREGITLTEYIISCYGARKGVVDTALKTANSGYLTRRLVDVSHHIIVCDIDCKTKRGVIVADILENKKVIVPLQNRLIGRILAENIYCNNGIIHTTNLQKRNFYQFALFFDLAENPIDHMFLEFLARIEIYPYIESKINRFWFATVLYWQPELGRVAKKWAVEKQESKIDQFLLALVLYWHIKLREVVIDIDQFLFATVLYWQPELGRAAKTWAVQRKDIQFVLFLNLIIRYQTKKNLVAQKNQEISAQLAIKITGLQKSVLVRSPLTCKIQNSICQLCYGWSLAHGKLVSLGEAVGVIAAQSIGEPGTQLTMRTFHTGGVFSGDIMNEILAPFTGKIVFSDFLQGMLIRTPHGKIAFLTKIEGSFVLEAKPRKSSFSDLQIKKKKNSVQQNSEKETRTVLQIPSLTILFVRNYEYVRKAQLIAEFSSMSNAANQRIQASHDLNSELEGEVYFKDIDLLIQPTEDLLESRTTCTLGSIWIFSGKICKQGVFSNLFCQPGDLVDKSSIIGQYETMSRYNGFISSQRKHKSDIKNFKENQKYKSNTNLQAISFSFNETKKYNYNLSSFKNEFLALKKKRLIKSDTFRLPINFLPKIPRDQALVLNNPKNPKPNQGEISTSKSWLNYPLISYSTQSLQYKKIGYSLFLFKNTKLELNVSSVNQQIFSEHQFFLSNSLNQEFQNSINLRKNFFFQSFPRQYQTKTGGQLICDNFYLSKKICFGEIFWIPEETYLVIKRNSHLNCINSLIKTFINKPKFRYQHHTKPSFYQLSKVNSATTVLILNPKKFHLKQNLKVQKVFESFKQNLKKISNTKNSINFYYNSQGKFITFSSKLHGYTESRFSRKKASDTSKSSNFLYTKNDFRFYLKNRLKKTNVLSDHKNILQLEKKIKFILSKKILVSNTEHLKPSDWPLEINQPTKPKSVVGNKKKHSFSHKFYEMNFRLNPYIEFSSVSKNSFLIQNLIKKKKLHGVFTSKKQETVTRLHSKILIQPKQNYFYQIKKINLNFAHKNIKTQISLKNYFYKTKKIQKINTKLLTKQRSIFLQPQFPWKFFLKQNKKTSLSFKSYFFYNEKEKKFLTENSFTQNFFALFTTSKEAGKSIIQGKVRTRAVGTKHLPVDITHAPKKNRKPKAIRKRCILTPGSLKGIRPTATHVLKKLKRLNYLKHKIKPGWIYFPQTSSQGISKHTRIVKPGETYFNDFLFDQYPTYYQYIPVNQIYIQEKKDTIKKNKHLEKQTLFIQIYKKFQIDSKFESIDYTKKIKNFTTKPFNFKVNNFILVSLFGSKNDIKTTLFEKKYLTIFLFKIKSSSFFNTNHKIFQLVNSKKNFIKKLGVVYKKILVKKYIKKNLLLTISSKNTVLLKKAAIFKLKQKNFNTIYFLKNANFQHTRYRRLKYNSYNHSINILKYQQENLSSIVCFQINNNTRLSLPIMPIFLFKNSTITNENTKLHDLQYSDESQIKNTLLSPKFFILICKVKWYSFNNVPEYKKILSQKNKVLPCQIPFVRKVKNLSSRQIELEKNPKTFFTYRTNFTQLWCNNKQNSTNLFFNLPAPDFYIQVCFKHQYGKEIIFSKNLSFFHYYIRFTISKNYKRNITKIFVISKPKQSNFYTSSNSGQVLVKKSEISLLKQNMTINPYKKKHTSTLSLLPIFTISIFIGLQFSSSRSLLKSEQIFNMKHKINPSQATLFSSENYISSETPLRYTNLLSSDDGEILNGGLYGETSYDGQAVSVMIYSDVPYHDKIPKSDLYFDPPQKGDWKILDPNPNTTEVQNFLILTSNDQITFSSVSDVLQQESVCSPLEKLNKTLIPRLNSRVENAINLKPSSTKEFFLKKKNFTINNTLFVSKYVRYGTRINHNFVIPVSGQIIQIEKSKITIRKAQPILFSSKGIVSVFNADIIQKNTLVVRLFYQRLQTGDIVQGIPKIEQLFEARQTNQGEYLFGGLHDQLAKIYFYYETMYDFTDAARLTLDKIQQVIVNSVQKVYRSQGVTIADKHLEIIIRQMTSKVKIIQPGQTDLLRGEIIDLDLIELTNETITDKYKKVRYVPVILGITRKSLETKSFISEASFQETTRVLAKSSFEQRTDFLKGLKENVILGHLVPAGTGFDYSALKNFNPIKLKSNQTEDYENYMIFKKLYFKQALKYEDMLKMENSENSMLSRKLCSEDTLKKKDTPKKK